MAQDFFDEEFEKLEKEQQEKQLSAEEQRQKDFDAWYNYGGNGGSSNNGGNSGGGYNNGSNGGSSSQAKRSNKPLWVVLICLSVVVAMALGWVLCAIFGNAGSISNDEQQGLVQNVVNKVCQVLNDSRKEGEVPITLSEEQLREIVGSVSLVSQGEQLTYQALVSNTFDYLRENYYKDISEAKWQVAVETAGTALMQTAGDQYCQLMSPQSYYNFVNQVSQTAALSGNQLYFGMTYSFSEGLGLYVSGVLSDSSCYGVLQEGDIVLKLTDIEYSQAIIDKNNLQIEQKDELVVAEYDNETFSNYMYAIQKANFHCLRNGDVFDTGVILRGKVGVEHPQYKFEFIEFYFDENCNNISTTNQNQAKHNTYELRNLDQLPEDTGYVRITEFMYYVEDNKTVYVDDEFDQVMKLFQQKGLKRLVLDLKGNPGGYVKSVCDIAGMLVTDQNLTEQQKKIVTRNSVGGNTLLITSLVPKNGYTEADYRKGTYSEYFGNLPTDKCNIVVWTDQNSASASELLTGALRDYGTGFQIGTRTYGKGIAQTYEPLPYKGTVVTLNGTLSTAPWAIYYTFAAYYSPLGTNIHGVGYTPEQGYDGLTNYADLWQATLKYWN